MRFTDLKQAFNNVGDDLLALKETWKAKQFGAVERFLTQDLVKKTPPIVWGSAEPFAAYPPLGDTGVIHTRRTGGSGNRVLSGNPHLGVEHFSERPGIVHTGGFLIQNPAPGPLVEAVDPADNNKRYGLGVHEEGKLRLYVPEADGSSSINLSVMTDAVNRKFDDVVSLKRQSESTDGGYTLALKNVNEVQMNGKSINIQGVVDRLQFQTHVDKVMHVTGTADTPFVTLNPDTRAVGISAMDPKGRMTLGTGGGAGAPGGDMVFEVGNTHDGKNPGFTAINMNGYYDRGEQVFDSLRARWRVGVMPDDRFFIDTWKQGWGAPRTVLSAPMDEDAVDINGNLRLSARYTGWAEAHPDRAEIVSDPNTRKMIIMPPVDETTGERRLVVQGRMDVQDRLITKKIEMGKGSIGYDNGSMRIAPPAGSDFVIGQGTNQNKLVIKSDGRVGVGTDSPASQLHVNGAVQIGGFSIVPEANALRVRNAETGAELATLGRI